MTMPWLLEESSNEVRGATHKLFFEENDHVSKERGIIILIYRCGVCRESVVQEMAEGGGCVIDECG